MKGKSLFQNIWEYENGHIALWLVKDTYWVMSFKIRGMVMVVSILAVVIYLTGRLIKNISDLFSCHYFALKMEREGVHGTDG